MEIRVRSERPGDEEAIDLVNCRAFGEMDEANIVRLMRSNYPAFDRRYSLTAWDGDQLVAHALFSPARLRLMGKTVAALGVGPVAVLPERQRQGIGGQLLQYGHQLGQSDGFVLSFLYGHKSYYPRYGYQSCFGVAQATIDVAKLPQPTRKFHCVPVRPSDIPWLVERFAAEWGDVDFAWMWGTSVTEWTGPHVNAVMWYTELGRRVAYTVARPGRGRCNLLLADDAAMAKEVIATVRPTKMEHHPAGWLAKNALDARWSSCEAKPHEAAMACELKEGTLRTYLAALEADRRRPGFCCYPLPFIGA